MNARIMTNGERRTNTIDKENINMFYIVLLNTQKSWYILLILDWDYINGDK